MVSRLVWLVYWSYERMWEIILGVLVWVDKDFEGWYKDFIFIVKVDLLEVFK